MFDLQALNSEVARSKEEARAVTQGQEPSTLLPAIATNTAYARTLFYTFTHTHTSYTSLNVITGKEQLQQILANVSKERDEFQRQAQSYRRGQAAALVRVHLLYLFVCVCVCVFCLFVHVM